MPLILGAIVMWSGSVEEIPTSWALCNGQNGTIDLRNKFVVGAGSLYSVGNTGGSADATVVSHNHSITTNAGGHHGHTVIERSRNSVSGNLLRSLGSFSQSGQDPYLPFTMTSSAAGSHSHTVALNTTGVSATNANLPPYYALAFIQQIA